MRDAGVTSFAGIRAQREEEGEEERSLVSERMHDANESNASLIYLLQ